MTSLAALVLIVVAIAFELFCVVKVVMAPVVRRLPRRLWALLCLCCNPLGGVAFLVLGWERNR